MTSQLWAPALPAQEGPWGEAGCTFSKCCLLIPRLSPWELGCSGNGFLETVSMMQASKVRQDEERKPVLSPQGLRVLPGQRLAACS